MTRSDRQTGITEQTLVFPELATSWQLKIEHANGLWIVCGIMIFVFPPKETKMQIDLHLFRYFKILFYILILKKYVYTYVPKISND